MRFSQRTFGIFKALAVVLSLALPLMLAVSAADARAGGGGSFGSRGSRTFSAPPVTRTAPNVARPFDRTITPQTRPGVGTSSGGFFNRPGLLGGLAAGFLGAGLFGMLFGGGLFGGLGGLSSLLGLLLQIGLIVLVVRFAMSWWQRRNAPAFAGPTPGPGVQINPRTGFGSGTGSNDRPLDIQPADYDTFERLLGEIQTAWSNEDVNTLNTLATPEMVSYFTQDLQANAARGVVNKVSDVKLLQGDLAEAWREGTSDYATVALRYSLVDKTIERSTGRVVEGSDQPQEVTDVWTFVRLAGGKWELSAIQQT
ncbi:MAG TPA: TIM44-like domain-containing protein [Nitrobacter sp.]|nr:TIM44-like domain-containing protein [Nitrobacter sp.]